MCIRDRPRRLRPSSYLTSLGLRFGAAVRRWSTPPGPPKVIGRLALKLARATDGELGVVKRHLRQRLAVFFVRDNVAMLGDCVPSFAPQELDGDADSG